MTLDNVKKAVGKAVDYASEKARKGVVAAGDTLKGVVSPIRGELESESKAVYPRKTTRRAICYAAKIYNFATDAPAKPGKNSKNGGMGLEGIDDLLAGLGEKDVASKLLMSQRRSYSYTPSGPGERSIRYEDTQPGLVIVQVEGERKKRKWRQIFVVFRGSRGDAQGKDNEQGAGWSRSGENVDWTANLDDEQVRWPFQGAVGDASVHRGFLSIYKSLRIPILQTLRGLDCDEILVTGHSLGGALTTLCAYDLVHELPDSTVVCLSFNAPRVGNEWFVRGFNAFLSDQTYTSVTDDGGFRQAFRFDQYNDPVTTGMLHSSRSNYVSTYLALSEEKRREVSEKNAFGKVTQYVPQSIVEGALGEKGARIVRQAGRRDAPVQAAIRGGQGLVGGGLSTLTKDSDWDKPFYHVRHRKTISLRGLHGFTYMLDEIVGSGTSGKLGIHT